jgi:hypothetical protein
MGSAIGVHVERLVPREQDREQGPDDRRAIRISG